jgi:hypothetical protein
MRGVWLLCAALGLGVFVGCGGHGGGGPDQPSEVDYTTFTTGLDVGAKTGALVVEFTLDGAAADGAQCRLALPGSGESEGYHAVTDASGLLRVGNIPGGTYDLYVSRTGAISKVIEVTVYAEAVSTLANALTRAPD